MPQSWVTNATTLFGFALIVYGLATSKMTFDQATAFFLAVGYGVGIGHKLDRVHESNERIYEATKPVEETLDQLVERGQK